MENNFWNGCSEINNCNFAAPQNFDQYTVRLLMFVSFLVVIDYGSFLKQFSFLQICNSDTKVLFFFFFYILSWRRFVAVIVQMIFHIRHQWFKCSPTVVVVVYTHRSLALLFNINWISMLTILCCQS